MLLRLIAALPIFTLLFLSSESLAQSIFLNNTNTTVSLGASVAPEPFANRSAADSLASIIDLPSANSIEFHTQSTHVWVSGGNLELDFDFVTELDLNALHFWNYHSEDFDVDDIDLTFFDASMVSVGSLLNISPALGNTTGSDFDPIIAEDITLSFSDVRFVNVVLSGTNNQVDFNNLGFSASASSIPEPSSGILLGIAAIGFGWRRRR